MRISFIIPFCGPRLANRTHQSLKQLQGDFEAVFVAYGERHKPSLPDVLSDTRCTLLSTSGGIGEAWRLGFASSRGDILVEVAGGDELHARTVQTILDAGLDPLQPMLLQTPLVCCDADRRSVTYGDASGRAVVWSDNRQAVAFDPLPPHPATLSTSRTASLTGLVWTRPAYDLTLGHAAAYDFLPSLRLVQAAYAGGAVVKTTDQLLLRHLTVAEDNYQSRVEQLEISLADRYLLDMQMRWARNNGDEPLDLFVTPHERTLSPPWRKQICTLSKQDACFGLQPLADNSQSVIRIVDLLPRLPMASAVDFLKEIRRVLRPGGWLLCALPEAPSPLAFGNTAYRSWWNRQALVGLCQQDSARRAGLPDAIFHFWRCQELAVLPEDGCGDRIAFDLIVRKDGFTLPTDK